MRNRRGQTNTIAQIVGVVFFLYIIIIAIITAVNINQGFSSALGTAFSEVSDFTYNSLGPLFNTLLGAQGDANNQFLMILSFILISIIIVGTLDSVNIFGDTKQGGLINFAVGIIVSIIGVRFMPSDMWGSLTAPSSAFVATILVGAPFIALFFVTMKIRSSLANKLLWLFYLIFMSYLIFFPEGSGGVLGGTKNDFMYIYAIFLLLAGGMMFFDATVRKYFYSEKHKTEIQDALGEVDLIERRRMRQKIIEWQKIRDDTTASQADRDAAQKNINRVRNIYKNTI